METDSYTCEICNQGFPREQNLQMHRRHHNVPWKLLKRDVLAIDAAKRVYVCPEPTCLHHEPCHALGDLLGIKKHFKRKHTNQRQWVCEKCSKGYAIQSDLKAHLKTCGTRGHSCDCGRVFSRVETFIEHQDTCKAPKPAFLLQSPTLSINTNSRKAPLPNSTLMLKQKTMMHHNFELQKLTSSSKPLPTVTSVPLCTQLKLSVGSASHVEKNESNSSRMNKDASKAHLMERIGINTEDPLAVLRRLKDEARKQLQISAEEKAFVEKRRQQANWQIEMAKQEMINANRIREQALSELSKAGVLKERAMRQINPNTLQITCNACKKQYLQLITKEASCGEHSPFASYVSSIGH
ncbi:protein indeterminate-domain 16-like isoform X2 [Cornus florida]|nr:protein indeterminate-domain 16-like isoform X2 [Cornus florida]